MQNPLSERELHVASWTAELALEMLESALLERWEMDIQDANELGFWRWRRKRELESRASFTWAMMRVIGKYRKEQRSAWEKSHGR